MRVCAGCTTGLSWLCAGCPRRALNTIPPSGVRQVNTSSSGNFERVRLCRVKTAVNWAISHKPVFLMKINNPHTDNPTRPCARAIPFGITPYIPTLPRVGYSARSRPHTLAPRKAMHLLCVYLNAVGILLAGTIGIRIACQFRPR